MNWKKFAIAAIALWVVTVIFIGFRFFRGTVETGPDNRQAVVLLEGERVFILTEMRQLLQAVQGIIAGVEANDMKAVAAAAKSGGMAMMVDDTPSLLMKLPIEFKTQGVGVHKYFDVIAAEAEKNPPKEKILSMLNTQLKSCVACHAGYQLKSN